MVESQTRPWSSLNRRHSKYPSMSKVSRHSHFVLSVLSQAAPAVILLRPLCSHRLLQPSSHCVLCALTGCSSRHLTASSVLSQAAPAVVSLRPLCSHRLLQPSSHFVPCALTGCSSRRVCLLYGNFSTVNNALGPYSYILYTAPLHIMYMQM